MNNPIDGFDQTRRTLLKGVSTIGALLLVPISAWPANDRVVFATWGGSWAEAFRGAWADPFTEKTGIPFAFTTGNTLGRLQAMVQTNNVEWDLMEGYPQLSLIGKERGLLEKLDYSVINRDGLMNRPEFFRPYSIPEVLFGRILAYNKGMPKKPTGWDAMWDLKNFPGKRAIFRAPDSGFLEAALLVDGVPADNLYPLDLDRAFRKLDEIREHIIWYKTVTQGEQIMRSGQASLGMIADGRAHSIIRHGAPIGIVDEATFLTWSVFVVPKGAPDKEAAMRFLNFVLNPRRQAALAIAYKYGPAVPAAWKYIPDDMADVISGGPHANETGTFLNAKWWTENLQSVNARFHQWLLSG